MDVTTMMAVAAVLIIVAVSLIAPRIGVAAPIVLVLVGIGCSAIPGAPAIEVEPEWILMIVLPPLLYSAAVNMPAADFRRDLKTIGALSVLLVIVSAFASGLVLYLALPQLSLPAAIAVGAVISPPDAVAATSIGKRLGLPPRLLTILEGEGLLNDATALVMLRSAIAATAGGISLGGAVGDFLYAVAVGVAVGLLVGWASVWVRSKLDQPVLTTSISFVVPFLAYLPAEGLEASGVLAVVVAGLVTGANSAKYFTAHDRITERTNWRTIQLLLESGVFLLMGFQLRGLVEDVVDAHLGVWSAVVLGLLATAVLVVVRIVFLIPVIALLRGAKERSRRQMEYIEGALTRIGDAPRHAKESTERFLRRKHADASFFATEGLGWRGGVVLAWSGMRGVVTLAAAQSLPADIPYRSQLVLIAFTVAIVTLVGQGATLPLVIKVLGIEGEDQNRSRREFALLVGELREAARSVLDNDALRRANGQRFAPDVIEQVRATSLAAISDTDVEEDMRAVPERIQERLELLRMLLDAEQSALLEARAGGTYRSKSIEMAQHMLDINTARIDGPQPG